ncbi:MAG TPA: redoxin family protein [Polyangiaceae bacterium]|nr:redoxin family protein [Polyangiaceae bacterium]
MTDATPATPPTGSAVGRFFRRHAGEFAFFVVALVGLHLWQTRGLASGPLPATELTTLDGTAVRVGEAGQGPMVLHFWATWCGVCRAEEGNVVELSRHARVVTIATQSGSGRKVAAYLAQRGVDFPVVVDEGGELARRFGVDKFPTTFFLDDDGQVASAEVGYTSAWGMRLRSWWSRW